MRLALVVCLALGCRGRDVPPAELARYLQTAPDPAEWALDRAAWDRLVVVPFTGLYDEYRRELADFRPVLDGPIETRPHFAGDPELTAGQARARWLLPTLFPSEVATAGGTPIDAVFVRDRDRWHAITGIDRILRARIDQRDPACGVTFDAPRPSKACRDTAWMVADATLRNEASRIVRACAIAKTACAKPSP